VRSRVWIGPAPLFTGQNGGALIIVGRTRPQSCRGVGPRILRAKQTGGGHLGHNTPISVHTGRLRAKTPLPSNLRKVSAPMTSSNAEDERCRIPLRLLLAFAKSGCRAFCRWDWSTLHLDGRWVRLRARALSATCRFWWQTLRRCRSAFARASTIIADSEAISRSWPRISRPCCLIFAWPGKRKTLLSRPRRGDRIFRLLDCSHSDCAPSE